MQCTQSLFCNCTDPYQLYEMTFPDMPVKYWSQSTGALTTQITIYTMQKSFKIPTSLNWNIQFGWLWSSRFPQWQWWMSKLLKLKNGLVQQTLEILFLRSLIRDLSVLTTSNSYNVDWSKCHKDLEDLLLLGQLLWRSLCIHQLWFLWYQSW